MKKMKLFIDTHDKNKGTFPSAIKDNQLIDFYNKYVEICQEEGVVSLQTLATTEEGRAFCINMAEDIESVKRAHDRAGLPYDSITEVKTLAPGDVYFKFGN